MDREPYYGGMNDMLDSKLGKICVIAYAVFAIGTFFVAGFCGSSCYAYVVLPALPWMYILASDLGISFPWAVYPIFILLNTCVAYVVGTSIEWLYDQYQQRA